MKQILDRLKNYGAFIGVLIAIVIVSLLLLYFNPTDIVAEMGVRNIYAFLFIFALLGGVSSFTSTSFYATVIALSSSGGLDPLTVGIIAGFGMSFGDSAFYLLGNRAFKAFFPERPKRVERVLAWLEGKPKWMMPFIIYIYSGFTPFPGDLLMMSLAVLGYPYKKAIVPMVLGNMTLITLLGIGVLLGIRLV